MNRVLYITYDGLLDPLGYSQVQPYLRLLARAGVCLEVISYEKRSGCELSELRRVEQGLASCGIRWHRLRYHKKPRLAATAWDVACGTAVGLWLTVTRGIVLIHARSYVAGLVAGILSLLPGRSFLFDMRGFWVDERVEGGLLRAGGTSYKLYKKMERFLLGRAGALVLLTRRGAEAVEKMIPPREPAPAVRVIPTCVDLELFSPPERKNVRRDREAVRLIYVGSLGTWYLIEEMMCFFGALFRAAQGSSLLVLTQSDPEPVHRAAAKLDLPEAASAVSVCGAPYEQVPVHLAEADCSIFFIRPSFSKQASCATKFAESLACGVPVVINAGIGDHDSQVRSAGVGVVLEKLDQDSYRRGAESLLELLADRSLSGRCREAARREFSLEAGTQAYLELYSLLSKRRC